MKARSTLLSVLVLTVLLLSLTTSSSYAAVKPEEGQKNKGQVDIKSLSAQWASVQNSFSDAIQAILKAFPHGNTVTAAASKNVVATVAAPKTTVVTPTTSRVNARKPSSPGFIGVDLGRGLDFTGNSAEMQMQGTEYHVEKSSSGGGGDDNGGRDHTFLLPHVFKLLAMGEMAKKARGNNKKRANWPSPPQPQKPQLDIVPAVDLGEESYGPGLPPPPPPAPSAGYNNGGGYSTLNPPKGGYDQSGMDIGPPLPSTSGPGTSYGALLTNILPIGYSQTEPQYGVPGKEVEVPQGQYGAPKETPPAPKPKYGPPPSPPSQEYGPSVQYDPLPSPPSQEYGSPAPQPPSEEYGVPPPTGGGGYATISFSPSGGYGSSPMQPPQETAQVYGGYDPSPPQTPQGGYDDSPPSQEYGPPPPDQQQPPSDSYGPPSPPSSSSGDHGHREIFIDTTQFNHGEGGGYPNGPPQAIQPVAPGQENEHHNIVFVRVPPPPPTETEVHFPPPPPQETKVYILTKQHEGEHNVQIVKPPPTKPSKPQVYFLRYAQNAPAVAPPSNVVETTYGAPSPSRPQSFDMYAPQMSHSGYTFNKKRSADPTVLPVSLDPVQADAT